MHHTEQLYKIDKQSKLPLYDQIQKNLRMLITNGHLNEGEAVPSEFELAKYYSVSRLTVRRAIDDLVRNNWLIRRQGVGTFIAKPTVASIAPSKLSFTDQMIAIGRKPSSKLINNQVVKGPSKVTDCLKIKQDTFVVETTRVRLADDIPILFETSFLSYEQFPLLSDPDNWVNFSLYKFLHDEYEINITKMDQTLKAVLLSKEEGKNLLAEPDFPAIQSDVIAYSNTGVPIEYSWSVSSGEKSEFIFHFRRGETDT